VWPVALQIQAALWVFAIAQGMGCKLELWEWGLGQLGRSAKDIPAAPNSPRSEPTEHVREVMLWDERPFSHPTSSERGRYCGCSEVILCRP
jgi:hypothetical protein